jgi:hypothetical protein
MPPVCPFVVERLRLRLRLLADSCQMIAGLKSRSCTTSSGSHTCARKIKGQHIAATCSRAPLPFAS